LLKLLRDSLANPKLVETGLGRWAHYSSRWSELDSSARWVQKEGNITRLAPLVLLLAFLTVITPASADGLTGTTVVGQLYFSVDPHNYFDPANGYVPSGFQNSAGTTVVINGNPTFGFNDSHNLDQANFTNNMLTISDKNAPGAGALNWEMIFTDSAFAKVSKVSDTFDNGGLSCSLVGDVLTITWAGDTFNGGWNFNAVFDIKTTSVPEPSSLLLLGAGLLGLMGTTLLRKRLA